MLGYACFERSGPNVRLVTLTAFDSIYDSSIFTGERFFIFRDYEVCLTFFVIDCLGYSHVGAEFAALVCAFSHWECPWEEFMEVGFDCGLEISSVLFRLCFWFDVSYRCVYFCSYE